MNPPKPFFYYSAYGLTIKSELALPALPSIQNVPQIDVTILLADLSDAFNRENLHKDYWQASPNNFYMHITDIEADFHVTNGDTIFIETGRNFTDPDLHMQVLGTCMGILAQQRNILPLHASCISKGNECIIISGQSGSGKSTLAMALNKKGYPLLSDDICALHFSEDNLPYVYPTIPQIKIGADSASALGVNTLNLISIFSKRIVPIDNRSTNQRHTIKTIFSIEEGNNNRLKIQELHGAQKMALLAKNTYTTPEIIKYLGKTSRHFEQCTILAKRYKVKQICRTSSLDNVSDLISTIENEFSIA